MVQTNYSCYNCDIYVVNNMLSCFHGKEQFVPHFQFLKPATHLAILYADRGEFDRQRKSQAIFATD